MFDDPEKRERHLVAFQKPLFLVEKDYMCACIQTLGGVAGFTSLGQIMSRV
ncbi:hypothetical protein RchiOBHm_Chr6g0277911 [Rosa chinensis]|uniref:Uncharacterized protein n=1 Tax=Rosa chinensis TaxID=74649 RepID=A0A2P6PSN5_ROSCH|nr:hypothetical protein RchiOBHm_Chr6g0277911 [Rosa chinensis]